MNKFSEFYESLSREGEHSPEFLVRNYLHIKQYENNTNSELIKELGDKLSSLIASTRMTVSADSKAKLCPNVVENLKFKESVANSVTKIGGIYSQTNFNNDAETLSAVTVDLVKNFQKIKIKIRVSKIKKGGSIFIGAVESELFKLLSHKGPAVWNDPSLTGKLCFYNNNSLVFGQSSSQLKAFS
jgi:hypothetical protein